MHHQGLSADGTVCLLWSRECQENKKRKYVRAQGLETYSVEKSTGLGMCRPSRGVKLPSVMQLSLKAAAEMMTDLGG